MVVEQASQVDISILKHHVDEALLTKYLDIMNTQERCEVWLTGCGGGGDCGGGGGGD